jgi:hypothetical protein
MGERWYEPGVQAFTSVDPILNDDPMAIVEDPELRSSYAYARNNPLTNVDTTGRRFGPVHVPLSSAFALSKSLKIDGKPLTETEQGKLRAFFITKSALRGRMAYFWLSRQESSESRQDLADLLDSKPVLEFEFENGKLNKIKIGFGVGKRKKLLDRSTPPASTQTTNTTNQAGATGGNAGGATSGPGATGGPPNKPLPPTPTSGGSAASGPVATGQTSGGGGATAATTGGRPK